jgi:hypothetical protein
MDQSTPPNDSKKPVIDWRRIYPHANHRWSMGVRPGDLETFLARRDSTAAVLEERACWLAADPDTYSALLPEALPALADTVGLARSLGADIDPQAEPKAQLLAIGRCWEADFVWMHADATGQHRLIGGVVCFPSGWALGDKLGRTMSEIHDPVPGLNQTLGKPIEAFMARQRPGDVWVRENVNFARDCNLNHHPAQPKALIDASVRPEEFWFRFEHQLLLKLPSSGSILFCIRIEHHALADVLPDEASAARLADIFTTMSEPAAVYKGIASAREILRAMCDGKGQK